MQKRAIQAIQLVVFSLLAVLLFRYVYSGEDLSKIINKVLSINPIWVSYSMAMAIASHYSRGMRWCLAIKPLGYKTSALRAFLAVLFGYFINSLPVPRLGEVGRCWLFSRMEKVPVSVSFGAVVAERVIDLAMLGLITILALVIEADRLGVYVSGLAKQNGSGLEIKLFAFGGLLLAGGSMFFLLKKFRSNVLKISFLQKILIALHGIKQGLLSLGSLSRTELLVYVLHTVFIWLMYYGMAYILVFSMAETENLPPAAGLTMVAMGGIGMAFPTPAGVGSYHYFMTQALSLYAVAQTPAKEFAFLLHSSQVFMAWVTGGFSFLVAYFVLKAK